MLPQIAALLLLGDEFCLVAMASRTNGALSLSARQYFICANRISRTHDRICHSVCMTAVSSYIALISFCRSDTEGLASSEAVEFGALWAASLRSASDTASTQRSRFLRTLLVNVSVVCGIRQPGNLLIETDSRRCAMHLTASACPKKAGFAADRKWQERTMSCRLERKFFSICIILSCRPVCLSTLLSFPRACQQAP